MVGCNHWKHSTQIAAAAEYILVTSLFCNRYKVNLNVGSSVSTGIEVNFYGNMGPVFSIKHFTSVC